MPLIAMPNLQRNAAGSAPSGRVLARGMRRAEGQGTLEELVNVYSAQELLSALRYLGLGGLQYLTLCVLFQHVKGPLHLRRASACLLQLPR